MPLGYLQQQQQQQQEEEVTIQDPATTINHLWLGSYAPSIYMFESRSTSEMGRVGAQTNRRGFELFLFLYWGRTLNKPMVERRGFCHSNAPSGIVGS